MVRGKLEISGRETAKRDTKRRNKIIIGVVIALILIIVLVVLLVVFLTGRSALEIKLNGSWGEWDGWSSCSRTCGSDGTQSRNRACNDPPPENDGDQCVGPSTEVRPCGRWSCPDCSRTCPGSGQLNADCSLCKCNGSVVLGKVLRSRIPLDGVEVFASTQQWKAYTTTDHKGAYQVEGLCKEGLALVFRLDGYEEMAMNVTVRPDDQRSIYLTALEKPTFQVHPSDQAVLVGGAVSFSCDAIGYPKPDRYQWYKNGNTISHNTPVFNISDVQLSDMADYKCQAINRAGKRFSRSAKLIVKEATVSDTCDGTPQPRLQKLPPSCVVDGDDNEASTTVDLGMCSAEVCTKSAGKVTPSSCCAAIKTVQVPVRCSDYQYMLTKVVACGCAECYSRVKDTYLHGKILLKNGKKLEPMDSSVEIRLLGVGYQGQSRHSYDGGMFNFMIPVQLIDGTGRLTAVFSQRSRQARILEQIKVIHYVEGTSTQALIILRAKPTPVTYSSAKESTVAIGEQGEGQAGSVKFPKEAFAHATGRTFAGEAKVYPTFYDPREPEDIQSAPGEFTYDTEEGETQELQTHGVLGLHVFDHYGNILHDKELVNLQLDTVALGIQNANGRPDASLWELESTSGNWKRMADLSYRRRERRQASKEYAVADVKIPYPLPYLNLEKPLNKSSMCEVKVALYTDSAYTQPLAGGYVQVLTKDPNSNTYLGFTSRVSNQKGVACVPIPCGYSHVLSSLSTWYLIPSKTHQLPSGFNFNTFNDSVEFTSPSIDEVVNGDGPIHRLAPGTCRSSSGSQDYYFQFALPNKTYGELNAVELRPSRKLSWYQKPANEKRQACVVRVDIKRNEGDDVELVAVSKFDGDDEADLLFGTYTSGLRTHRHSGSHIACLQVKCPGKVEDKETNKTYNEVPTHVHIQVLAKNSSGCVSRFNPQILRNTPNPDYGELRAMVPIESGQSGVTFRARQEYQFYAPGYFQNYGNFSEGFHEASARCIMSTSAIAEFDCTGNGFSEPWDEF